MSEAWLHWRECRASLFKPDVSAACEVSTYPRRLSSNHLLFIFPLTCMETKHPNNGDKLILQSLSTIYIAILHQNRMETQHPNNGVKLILQSLSSIYIAILHQNRMETQHPNNVVDLILLQLYCHRASNPNGNAASSGFRISRCPKKCK